MVGKCQREMSGLAAVVREIAESEECFQAKVSQTVSSATDWSGKTSASGIAATVHYC